MEPKRPASGAWLMVGLLLLTVGGVVGLLPVLECPLDPYLAYTDLKCPRCQGRGRITLLNRARVGPQAPPAWEGLKVGWIEGAGFNKTNFRSALDLADIFGGVPFTTKKRIAAAKALLETGRYEKVSVVVEGSPSWGAAVRVVVVER